MTLFTQLFLILIAIVWLRLLTIFTLVIIDILSNKKEHQQHTNNLRDITVLIPAYQEENALDITLHCAQELATAGAAVVMIDDGSTDKTNHLLEKFAEETDNSFLIVKRKNRGKAQALNTGLEQVNTTFVLTLDADTEVSASAVLAAHRKLTNSPENYSVVAFDVSVKPTLKLFSELQGLEYDGSLNFERRGQAVVTAVSVAPGAASLWKTEDLLAINGFSDDTVTEDVDATLKLASVGKRATQTPEARAFTGTPKTFSQLMIQRHRWCLGHYQNIPRHMKNLGKDAVFTFLTYPNFFLLSAFMPAMLALSAITLFADSGIWKDTLGWFTAIWLCSIYLQRWFALKLAKRQISITAFILEPFTTLLFHICAMFLAINTLIKQIFGIYSNPWKKRKR